MKIITWNINRNNFLTYQKLKPILDLNSDILLFQEVSPTNLQLLKYLLTEYYCFHATETLISLNRKINYFLCTFVKKSSINKIISNKTIQLPTYQPLIYKLFNRKIHIQFSIITVQTHQDIFVDIINCHLQYATSPSKRLKQFQIIKNNINNKRFIIGGDLNTFSSFPIACFTAYLFDYSKKDLFIKEAKNFTLINNDLNTGSPYIQTSIYQSGKLDWICCSSNTTLSEQVLPYRQQSDHFPVMADLIFTHRI